MFPGSKANNNRKCAAGEGWMSRGGKRERERERAEEE